MKWHNYVACFFAGLFLANVGPHLIRSVTGDAFPSLGTGKGSLTINVLFALSSLVIGYILFRAGKISYDKKWTLLVFFAGILCMNLMLGPAFVDKMHQ